MSHKLISYLWIIPASAVYALGFNWCFVPNDIAFGGLTGVAQIINRFLPQAPVGTLVILLNIPLFLLGWRLLGGGPWRPACTPCLSPPPPSTCSRPSTPFGLWTTLCWPVSTAES